MVYRFKLVSDEADNFSREIEIDSEASFLQLRNAILDSVGYSKDELDSFFLCDDDWQKEEEITNYLRHHSRSYIFTASITPASTAAASAALDIIIAEPERQTHLWDITNYALENFRAMGCEIGHTSTPIIPIFIRDDYKTFRVTRDLLDEGVFVNPVVTPAVAPQDTLIRYSLMATHTKEQVTRSLEAIEKVLKKNGVIKK